MNQRPTSLADHAYDILGVHINFLATPGEVGKDISLFRGLFEANVIVPLHSHSDGEIIYALRGHLDVYREHPGPGWTRLSAGQTVVIPGNVKHALRNSTEQTTELLLVSQEQIYNFFRLLAKPLDPSRPLRVPSPEEMHEVFAAAQKYHYWMATPEENAEIGITLTA